MPQGLSDRELLQVYRAVKMGQVPDSALSMLDQTESSRLNQLVERGLPGEEGGKPYSAEEFMPPGPEGSAMGRFASNAGELLNPVNLAKGLYGAVRSPIETVKNVGRSQYTQGAKGVEALQSGNVSEGLGRLLASVVPLLGPAAAEAGEQMATGDVAGGLGKGAALLVPTAIPAAVRGLRGAMPTGAREAAASSLEAGAARRVTDVMSPKVGPKKLRFGNKAEQVAPELLKRGEASAWSRDGLAENVKAGVQRSKMMLDEAADNRLSGRPIATGPIKEALLKERAKHTAQPFEADLVTPEASLGAQRVAGVGQEVSPVAVKTGSVMGRDVVPAPNRARVAAIDQAIKEIEALGPQAPYEALRRIRQAYDGPAETIYNPSMTADFLTAQGGKLGAADVTGTLRSTLAKADPRTAAANAEYSLYRSADDVLSAVAEVERVRPRVGRAIMARLTGTVAGQQAAGLPGAAAGYLFAPVVDSALASGFTTQLKTAQLMQNLATAVRSGNVGRVDSLMASLRRLGAQGATIQGATASPTESRSTGAPALQPQPIR